VGARLLAVETSGEGGGTTVELVHESLLERWGKLRRWLDESEDDALFLARLRGAGEQCEAGARAAGRLCRGPAAGTASGAPAGRRTSVSASARRSTCSPRSPSPSVRAGRGGASPPPSSPW